MNEFLLFASLFNGNINLISHSKNHAIVHYIEGKCPRTFIIELKDNMIWILSPVRTWKGFERTLSGLIQSVRYIQNENNIYC